MADAATPTTRAAAERAVLAEGLRELANKLGLMRRLLKEGAETDLELTLEGLVQNAGGLADTLLCAVGEFSKTEQGEAGQWLLSPVLAEAIDTARDHGAGRPAHAGA
jgi:hypothetical protein